MRSKYEAYLAAALPTPKKNLVWNLYGTGKNSLGRNGKPEEFPVPVPGPEQILARIDCVGICYSDVKLLQQGGQHAKLKGRDLQSFPTRPGHEASLTIVQVGSGLKGQYRVGQRFAVQPEIVRAGVRATYGFSIPGALAQYHLIGPELLKTDAGANLLEIQDEIGFSEAALFEPFGSVLSAFDQNRRLEPLSGGKMWVIGQPGMQGLFTLSKYMDRPSEILLTDVAPELEQMFRALVPSVRKADGLFLENYSQVVADYTRGSGFDDVILLNPQSARQIEALVGLSAPGGLLNLVGPERISEPVNLDVHRVHYSSVAVIGNSGPDIAVSYGSRRNRSDFRPGGTALLVGAGGPIGQMHLLRVLQLPDGPRTLIVLDTHRERLEHARRRFRTDVGPRTDVHYINPRIGHKTLAQQIFERTGARQIDDAVILVPNAQAMAETLSILRPDGLVNFFAGTPRGMCVPVEISNVYLDRFQITGASGLLLRHQQKAYGMARNGAIDTNSFVAAVGGMNAAADAIESAEYRKFAGKIMIYPQLESLPLMGLSELRDRFPEAAGQLGPDARWTRAAERLLLEAAL